MKNFYDFFKPASPPALPENEPLFQKYFEKQLFEWNEKGEQASQYVRRHLSEALLKRLSTMAWKNLAQSLSDGKIRCEWLVQPPVCYGVAALPMAREKGKEYFSRQHGGFGAFLERLKNELPTEGCEVFCLAFFGKDGEEYWSYLTIGFAQGSEMSSEKKMNFFSG